MIQESGFEVLAQTTPSFASRYSRSASSLYCACHAIHLPGLTCGHIKVPSLTQPALRPVSQNLTRTPSPPVTRPWDLLISVTLANRIRESRHPMCMVNVRGVFASLDDTKNISKEADTFVSLSLSAPSHRSASMTARLVLCVCITPNGSCRLPPLFVEENYGLDMSRAPNPQGRPPPSAAICRSRSCRWLGADSRYALPFSVQVLTFCCATHGSPGPASSHPHTAYQWEGNDVVSTRTTPLFSRGAATEISCYFVIGRCVKPWEDVRPHLLQKHPVMDYSSYPLASWNQTCGQTDTCL